MSKAKDIRDFRFGMLVAIETVGSEKAHRMWRCKCDCGNEVITRANSLLSGNTRTCGCSRLFHGHARKNNASVEYTAYQNARARCIDSTKHNYHRYGGRGIEFRFRDFKEFLAAIGPKPKGFTLDRINTSGHYEPGNVRWVTWKAQRQNQERMLRGREALTANANSTWSVSAPTPAGATAEDGVM